ncbi:response regulator [Paenibacillus eucommiae]|uniref:Two-component system response regulator YesN n=1 Tax=Paenibacillus eucommiae TaxID=1355755 RepID=A0ABS4IPG8_9BACL|nr:response regulator [Paenibacillus eucommiae]MBP1989454.1 two-component system response regulator YesN [Paenibacillus eucommiae]
MKKLFIVEDEEIIRKGLVHSIEWHALGFEVCGEAANGKQALPYILDNEVDVVMTDVRMPVLDGLELTRQIKVKKPGVKIVILTGFSEFEYARQSLEYGVFQYILKPIKRDKLAETFMQLREILDREQAERTEKQLLQQQVEAGSRQLREEKLNAWIHDQSDADIGSLISGLLHSTIEQASYICAVLDIDNAAVCATDVIGDYKRSSSWFLPNAASQVMEQADLPVSFQHTFDNDGRLVLLVSMPATGEAEYAGQRLEQTMHSLMNEISLRCSEVYVGALFSAGIGRAVDIPDELPQSYRQAADALAYRFYTGGGSINFSAAVPALRSLNYPEFQQLKQAEETLTMYITAGNGDLEPIFEDMFGHIARHRNIEYESVKHAAVQMLYSVCGYATEQSHDIEMKSMNEISLSGLSDLTHILSFAKQKIEEVRTELKHLDQDDGRNLVKRVKEFVIEQYMNEISLTDIAERFYVNSSYFSWLFRQETGVTFTSFLTLTRVGKAKELLKQDMYKVYEVASAVGYNDYRHFCKIFKREVGISPKQYTQHGK